MIWIRRHVQGVCEKVAKEFESSHGVKVDATTQITLCCGQSEAMAATMLSGTSNLPLPLSLLMPTSRE